jgi:hypothetical protein
MCQYSKISEYDINTDRYADIEDIFLMNGIFQLNGAILSQTGGMRW